MFETLFENSLILLKKKKDKSVHKSERNQASTSEGWHLILPQKPNKENSK